MATVDELIQDAMSRMDKSVDSTKTEFNSVRTGRASAALLDRVQIDYYGQATPLKQLATISVPEPRMLTIQPFDPSSVKAIEKAIQESDLGLTPSNDGKLIRSPIPARYGLPLSFTRSAMLSPSRANRVPTASMAGPAGTVAQTTPLTTEQKAIYQALSTTPPARITAFDPHPNTQQRSGGRRHTPLPAPTSVCPGQPPDSDSRMTTNCGTRAGASLALT